MKNTIRIIYYITHRRLLTGQAFPQSPLVGPSTPNTHTHTPQCHWTEGCWHTLNTQHTRTHTHFLSQWADVEASWRQKLPLHTHTDTHTLPAVARPSRPASPPASPGFILPPPRAAPPPPSSSSSSPRSLLRYVPSVAPLLAPPPCLPVHPYGFTSDRIGPASRAGRTVGRTDVFPSSRYRSLLHPPRLSLDSPPPPPLPPLLLLLFLRYRDPARHRITSRHRYWFCPRYCLQIPLPFPRYSPLSLLSPLSSCRTRQRTVGRSVCFSTQAHRGERGAQLTRAAAAATTNTHARLFPLLQRYGYCRYRYC